MFIEKIAIINKLICLFLLNLYTILMCDFFMEFTYETFHMEFPYEIFYRNFLWNIIKDILCQRNLYQVNFTLKVKKLYIKCSLT